VRRRREHQSARVASRRMSFQKPGHTNAPTRKGLDELGRLDRTSSLVPRASRSLSVNRSARVLARVVQFRILDCEHLRILVFGQSPPIAHCDEARGAPKCRKAALVGTRGGFSRTAIESRAASSGPHLPDCDRWAEPDRASTCQRMSHAQSRSRPSRPDVATWR